MNWSELSRPVLLALRRAVGLALLGLSPTLAFPQPADDPFCRRPPPLVQGAVTPGTRAMVERLARLARDAQQHPGDNPFLSDALARHTQRDWEEALESGNAPRALQLQPILARHWLNAGENEAALRLLLDLRSTIRNASWRLDTRQSADLTLLIATAYLRIGEQQNCLPPSTHSPDACLLPVQPGGIHRLSRGANGAFRVLTEHLQNSSSDLRARWLLNLAAMLMGTPAGTVPLPETWRIPPERFASEFPLPRFTNVAAQVGLDVDDLAGGCVIEDFNGDDWLDVMASSSALDGQLRLFLNTGTGAFIDATAQAGLSGLSGGLNLVSTDFDNDGLPDVLVLRGGWLGRAGHHPNSLLRNLGGARFDDVTESVGLLTFHPTQTATWFDYDGDGWLDLFIGNESTPGDPHPCELFHNLGGRRFQEVAALCGLAVPGKIKGVASGDFNNDGQPDLYLSDGDGPNRLFRNDGPLTPSSPPAIASPTWRFTDITASAGVAAPHFSFPTWFWDYDNDGWLDLFVGGYHCRDLGDIAADYLGLPHSAERPRLYRNRGDGTFENLAQIAGLDHALLPMGANFGDLDNDGWLDFYLGTGDPDLSSLMPNRMFRNADGRRFQDVTSAGGFGHLQKGHAVAFADLDHDGDHDVYQVLGGAFTGDRYPNALFLNPGTPHPSITLQFEGRTSPRSALGTRIQLTLQTPNGRRILHRTVTTGGSFGCHPFRQIIGLGDATDILDLSIRWPAGNRLQQVRGLTLGKAYRIREGDEAPRLWPLPTLPTAAFTPADIHPSAQSR